MEIEATTVTVTGSKQRAVRAMLSTRYGRVVTTDALVEGIWGDKSPTAVSLSVHSYVSRLGAAIDQRIEHRGSGYLLAADACVTHVGEIPRHNPP